jgi:hypothetical protein
VGSPDALSPGRHTVEFDFKYDGIRVGPLEFNNFSGGNMLHNIFTRRVP